MDFAILGPLAVHVEDRPLDLGGRKQRAVLAMLLLDANRVVSLDRLIDRLWGDEAPPTATSALQVYVSHLRRLLEPARRAGGASSVLVTEAPGYRLAVDAVRFDAACFEAEVATGVGLLGRGRPQEASGVLHRALGRWRGPVLADFQGEAFTVVEAARLEELRLVAIEERFEADLALGAHHEVVGDLEAQVAAFPYRERLWGLLMVALYRSQRQADALGAFTRARRVLAEELGLDPGPELRRLENEILAHAPSLNWQPQPAEPAGPPGPVVARPADASAAADVVREVFVGRRQELAALEAAVGEIVCGRPRIVLVSGEPGIGKTRLVEELVRVVSGDGGPAVAWGRCPEGEGTPPYWPWATVLETLLVAGGDTAVAAVRPGAGEVAQIAPWVKELVADVTPPPAVDAATARFRLHRAVAGFLETLAGSRPVVVVLDDVHWADPASLELLRVVAGEVTAGVALVATYRDVDAGPHNLADLLGSLARDRRLVRIRLSGFDADEVGQLVARAGGGVHPSAAVVEALRARTDGNPFFVAELAKMLASERRWDAPASVMAAAIPDAVSDVILRRLARLPDDTRKLLDVAAVAGRDFDIAVVAAAAEVDEDQAVDSVDVALASGLVVDDRDRPGRYRFSHALIQETVEGRLSAMRRARLHARVGEVIAEGPDADTRAGELAHHFTVAAPVRGIPTALRYTIAAARSAQAAFGFEDAEQLFRRATAMAAGLPDGAQRTRLALEAQLALAAFLARVRGFTVPSTVQAWDEAARLAAETGDPAAVVDSSWGLMLPALGGGDFATVATLGRRLLALASASGHVGAEVVGHFGIGFATFGEGDVALATSHVTAALGRSRDIDPDDVGGLFGPLVLAVFLPELAGGVAALAGDAASASALCRRGVEAARGRGTPVLAAALVGTVLMGFIGRSPDVVSTASDKVADIGRAWFPDYGAVAGILGGWAKAQLGAVEEGLADIEAGIETHRRSGFALYRTAHRAAQAETLALLGRHEEARRAVEAGFEAMEATGERFYEAELHRLNAELLLAAQPDARQAAIASLQHAVKVASAQHSVTFLRRAQTALDALSDR